MNLKIGREICGNIATAEHREWLVTNGIGGYASGTVSGLLTRCYHGLLLAALEPPLGRTLLLTKLEETVTYQESNYPLFSNRWQDNTISPHGYKNIERFYLDGTTPVWVYGCADALIEKRIWMKQGENTTYIQYKMLRGSQSINLGIKALVNHRDSHGNTQGKGSYQIACQQGGSKITAFDNAASLYLSGIKNKSANNQDAVDWQIKNKWYQNFALAVEKYRGLNYVEDHLYAANCNITLNLGESVIIVGSTEEKTTEKATSWQEKQQKEKYLIKLFSDRECASEADRTSAKTILSWIEQLVLAADQFIVDRSTQDVPEGKTIIAGYPWFGDWGRDTMISLPGLTLTTGRFDIARTILRTFARYVDKGMLPNLFPDAGEIPEYNTVDATLWYFEAIRDYVAHTQDKALLTELFPALADIIDWHRRGTRYNIHLDSDGLIYAGEKGVQLTWMDAKVEDWVVTPRIGKPVEVNALWYNALIIMSQFARYLDRSDAEYIKMATETKKGFQRFWNQDLGYCYDVLDTPDGNDDSLRPNQIFAVSLPVKSLAFGDRCSPLLNHHRQKQIVDSVCQNLLTSYGLRSLDPNHPDYVAIYGGDRWKRDAAYHQGTVWGWLIGHFVQAHLKVYQNPAICKTFLEPMSEHLAAACMGNLSEIFDGDAPFIPRGAFAQAWTVAEVLRGWELLHH